MAEARSVVDLYYTQKAVKTYQDDDGYYSVTIKIPSPSTFLGELYLTASRLKSAVVSRIWPATPTTLLAVMGGVTYLTVSAKSESWVRSGWLANFLWDIDTKLGSVNPLHKHYPTSFRVGYLASAASFVGMLGIVTVERFLLRIFLSWHGWMYGANSVVTTIWGAGVKMLSGHKNLTYAFDMSLPTLPLPSLRQTCDQYLESIRPLLSADEYEKYLQESINFQKNEGRRFQRYLWLKFLFSSNYVLEWWEKYCYLYGRTPIAVNSNYYVADAKNRPTLDPIERAAGLTHHFLVFKDLVENEQLEPMTIRNLIPICMRQYERMFGTTRIPGRECDRLEHNKFAKHIIVVSRGQYYKLDVYHKRASQMIPYSTAELEVQLSLIDEHSKRQQNQLPVRRKPSMGMMRSHRIQSFEDLVVLESTRGSRKGGLTSSASTASLAQSALKNANTPSAKLNRKGANIAAFTAGPRSRWAEVRDMYLSEGVNKKSLRTIETAAFVVWLDDTHYSTLNERAQSLFHGNGSNRWFDKTINLVVFNDGYAGLNCEHSWADAPAIAHLWEYALLNELKDFQSKVPKKVAPTSPTNDGGDVAMPLRSDVAETKKSLTSLAKKLPVPKRLLWEIDDEFQVAIDQSHAFAQEIINDVDLEVIEHLEYGKGFIKKNRMSPDGFLQMALQLAYYRNQGHHCLTYESSMTRIFRGGRTETIRSLSKESCEFVQAMEKGASKEEVIAKLRVACARHAKKNKDMMVGKGCDRHLFALYIVSKGLDSSSQFLNNALSRPWSLSSSQQPQNQTLLRKDLPKEVADRFVSPGGGFGPVSEDGYGVSYMFAGENMFFFHISSKFSAENTSSKQFASDLMQSLEDMSNLFR